mgnify:CR=1 FL=1
MRKRAELLPAAAAVLLPVAVGVVFFYAPEQRTMGLVQKIFYFHLSLAAAAFLSFLVACGAGVAYLVKRKRQWDALGAASVEVGVLFTSLVLVTGSLWGRPICNTWRTWDPRLTPSLILWFIYAACMILRAAVDEETKRATYTAVMAIVGFVDVPIVFLSARLFRSIHPTVLRSDSVGLEPAMVKTLLVSMAAVFLLWASLVQLRRSLFMQEAALKDLQTRLES